MTSTIKRPKRSSTANLVGAMLQLEAQLKWADSYTRLPILLDSFGLFPSCAEWKRIWFRQLGEEWTICDNIGVHHRELSAIFSQDQSRAFFDEMMNGSERTLLAESPEMLTIFRGCGPHNRLGLSWSLRREVAQRFPLLHRYRTADPLLIEAKIPISQVVALKQDREEAEVIALVGEQNIIAEMQSEKGGSK